VIPTTTNPADRRAPTQRQWQRDRTMAEIQRASLKVFARLGYSATTAEHLADAAGVSVRTLFRYFPSGKDDVLLADLRHSLDLSESALYGAPDEEPLADTLRRASTTTGKRMFGISIHQARSITNQIAREQPDLMARLLGERQLFAERLVTWFGDRLGLDPESDLRPRLFAHCYIAAIVSGYLTGLENPRADASRLIGEAIDLITPMFER